MNAPATIDQEAPIAPLAVRAPLAPVGRIDLNSMGFEEMQRVSQVLVACGFYKDIQGVAQAVAKLIVGQELGLTIYEAMTGIRFVEGKLEMAPALMGARINRSKEYSYEVERDDKDGFGIDNPRCIIAYYRKVPEKKLLGRMEWSHIDTVTAQLANKDNWKKYGRAMRWARCMSAGTKAFCGDIIGGGAMYVEGELDSFNGATYAPSNVTPIASAPSAVAAIDAEDPIAKQKMQRITEIAGELMVTAAKMSLDVDKCDGNLDKLLAQYEQMLSAKKPARGSRVPAATIPAPASPAFVVVGETPVVTSPPAVGGEPAKPPTRSEPGKLARQFIGTPFEAKADRLAFAAHHLVLDGDLQSFNDLSDEQLVELAAKLRKVMAEIAVDRLRGCDEANEEAAADANDAPVKTTATKAVFDCPACGVESGQEHFSDCEIVA